MAAFKLGGKILGATVGKRGWMVESLSLKY